MAEFVPANDVEKIPFQRVLDALLDVDRPFHPRYLHRLSDLERTDLAEFESNWPHVPVQRRLAVLQDIEEITESNYLLSFKAVCKCVLGDDDARVRRMLGIAPSLQQRIVDRRWFAGQDVQCHSPELPGSQRIRQNLGIDNRAPRRVDQVRPVRQPA